MSMFDLLRRLWHHESGDDTVEYALLTALLVLVLAIALYHLGKTTNQTYQSAGGAVANASGSGGGGGGNGSSGAGGSAAGGQTGGGESGGSTSAGSSSGSRSGSGSGSGSTPGNVNNPPVPLGTH
jgi:Flp pilus assembly pilin Flp